MDYRAVVNLLSCSEQYRMVTIICYCHIWVVADKRHTIRPGRAQRCSHGMPAAGMAGCVGKETICKCHGGVNPVSTSKICDSSPVLLGRCVPEDVTEKGMAALFSWHSCSTADSR